MERETPMKSEPSFHIDDVEIEDVAPEVKNEPDPSQIDPVEVKLERSYERTEVSEAQIAGRHFESARWGKQVVSTEDGSCGYEGDRSSQSSMRITVTMGGLEGACRFCEFKATRVIDVVQHSVSCHLSPPPDQLQLDVNEVETQDCGPVITKKPEMILDDDNSSCKSAVAEGQLFECYHCWYKTKNKLSLEDHMRTHLVEKPYACDLCDFKASQKNYLLQHKKAHAVFGCSICDYKSVDKSRVKDHLEKAHRTPSAEKLLRCPACDYETLDEAHMKRHIGTRHVEDNYKCRICDYKTHHKRSLQTHMVTNHPGVKPFACVKCDYKASCLKNLQKHMKIHSAEKPFSCDLCEFRAAAKHSLEAHKKIHRDRPFACTICDYKSYTKSNVNDHVKIHTGEKPLACTFCPYGTRKKSDLKRHMKTHSTKKKPYKCKICHHRTNEKYTLEKHMKTHTGAHEFSCTICAKSYVRKSALCDHVLKSHADRQGESLKCQSCDYTDKKASELTNHILSSHAGSGLMVVTAVETGDSFSLEEGVQLFSSKVPFVCHLCDITVSKEHIKSHIMIHDGKKPFACHLCDYTSKRDCQLEIHRMTHLGEKAEPASLSDDVKVHDVAPEVIHESGPPQIKANPSMGVGEMGTQDYGPNSNSESKILFADDKTFICDVCDYKTPQNRELRDHMHVRTGERPLECDLCDTRFRSKRSLADHRRIHSEKLEMSGHSVDGGTSKDITGDQMFECYHCWYKTRNKLSLEDHMRTHLVERPFACDKCDFRAIRKNHLEQHKKTHVRNVYGCSLCDYKSYERWIVKRHLRVHKDVAMCCTICNHKALDQSSLAKHMETCAGKRSHECKHCEYKANNRRDLRTHMRTHNVEKSCKRCDYRANDWSDLKAHKATHAGEKSLACSYCDYRTNDRSSLKTHLTIHTGEKPFKCTYCDYCTNDRDCLTGHVANHTGQKPFPCDCCEFKTTCRNNLRKHKKLKHSELRPYVCEQCDFKSASEPAFKRHTQVHSGEKPFACNACDYRSYNKSNVVAHQKIHTGENCLTCTYCPYSAKNNSHLKRHMKVHSTEKKRFKCKECRYRTADKKAFKKHKRVHTGQMPFGCTLCDKKYNRRRALLDHVAKNHASSTGMSPTEVETSIPPQHDVSEFLCYACDYESSEVSHVEEHILSTHSTTLADGIAAPPDLTSEPEDSSWDASASSIIRLEEYFCYACDYKARNIEQVQQHILSAHNPPIPEASLIVDLTTES